MKGILIVILAISLSAGSMAAGQAGLPRLAGPTAVISSPANGALFETGALIDFDGSKSTGSSMGNNTYAIVSWAWDFGDGASGYNSMARHMYQKGGSYTVTLTVTDAANMTANATIMLYLAPPAKPQVVANQPAGGMFNPAAPGGAALQLAGPTAVISSPGGNALFETGSNVFFDGSKSTGTVSGNASYPLVSWMWSLGDGTNASYMFVNHTYANAGAYIVFLTVFDSQGTSAMASVTIYVSPPARPQNIACQPQGGWGFNPSAQGGFSCALAGAAAVISCPADNALFGIDRAILFDGSKSTGSTFQNITYPIVSWNWSFGDGQTGSGTTIAHSYASAGSYTVQLTVTDSNGAGAFTTIIVVISPPEKPQQIPVQASGGTGFCPAMGGMGAI